MEEFTKRFSELDAVLIDEFKSITELQLYPNPSNGIVTFQPTNNNQISEIEVYNMMGQIINIEKPNSKTQKIDLSYLNDGNYIMKLYDKNKKNEVKEYKIVIQK